jgi:hypothetical protein
MNRRDFISLGVAAGLAAPPLRSLFAAPARK